MRRKDREVRDPDVIRHILRQAKILHLGLNDSPFPYVVPMHYGYEFDGDVINIYLHCAREGKKLDLIRQDPSVCVTIETDVQLIESGQACNYGSAYASLMIFGTAQITEDIEEKKKGLALLMENQTGKAFTFDDRSASSVTVIRITSKSFTAKSRPKPSNS
jgi:nitroimidazol reductase NimA-like FMN-containing flavoprotein (pyridoxamine 5'-phosphate oxidase superfamily)